MKTLDDYFLDWESHVFGYGYGSGEEYVLPCLKRFMAGIPKDGSYDYRELEKALGGAVTWLLINALARANIIEYGTSPRFAWCTQEGSALRDYLASKTDAELEALFERDYDDYCYPDHCNCQGRACHNPFWRDMSPRGRN